MIPTQFNSLIFHLCLQRPDDIVNDLFQLDGGAADIAGFGEVDELVQLTGHAVDLVGNV